ncbi:hypothetical protein Tco_0849406 [Tanacetum coccineum]
MGDGCWTGEWIWAEDGEAGVGGATVGDCWVAGSVGCCWCGNGSVCPILGVVRVGFETVWCRSKVSSKKVKATIPSVRRGISQKNGRCCTWFKFVRWIKGMSLAIAVEGKTSHSVERFGDMKSGIEFHFGQKGYVGDGCRIHHHDHIGMT